jgi:2OG-Fe(II) oxygenase superfamily
LRYLSNVRSCSDDEEDEKPAATEKLVTKNGKKPVAATQLVKKRIFKEQSTVTAAALPAKKKFKKSTATPSNKSAIVPSKKAAPAVVDVLLVRSTRIKDAEGRWGRWVRDNGPPILIRDHRGVTTAAANAAAPGVKLLSHSFGPGLGCLYVAPDLISTATHEELTQEIRTRGGLDRFREYPIQGAYEPRTHFLLHAEATRDVHSSSNDTDLDTTTPQPGYGYGRGARSLKARPLNDFPLVTQLAATVEEMARHHDITSTKTASTTETYWNIGANVVCYRDGRDHIGLHADKDQGENVIFTVIAQSSYSRRIVIQSKAKDVLYELFLRAGDGYCMDGTMQQHFLHGLPPVKSQQYQNEPRIVIVFRRGQKKMIKRDTGRPVTSLAPRTPLPRRRFGHLIGMDEGHVYTMKQLKELHAHSNPQAGVSGNKTEGCDSIVVSHEQQGLGDDEQDSLFEFSYTGVQRNFGGLRLDQHYRYG